MVAVKETGLFDLMKARGDIFILHEGVWWDEPIDQGSVIESLARQLRRLVPAASVDGSIIGMAC